MASKMALLSLGLMVVGFGGGYALRDGWASFALYHVGGLGASSLLACAAGAIARKKGRGYWRPFSLALSLPIVLGVIAAYLVPPSGDAGRPAACGGSVSLAVALIFIMAWAVSRARRVEPI